ncbi:MAG: peroxiredoxin family protein [Fidelibacterota bacterium]|jgi:peroxiredoxin Q/BCP|tara:strand:+ start:1404 stop:1928 length:525 start_codon:yes stop_codon:yes gene_type:complete
MRLRQGEQAPNFDRMDYANQTQSIEKYRGKKLLISFFRYASCPLCNLQVHKLINHYTSWKNMNFEILAIFESTPESIKEYVGQQDAPFPIIPDPDLTLYKLFKLESNWLKFVPAAIPFLISIAHGFYPGKTEGDRSIVPANFLIDEKGKIQKAYYGKHIGDHLSMKQINQFIIQ